MLNPLSETLARYERGLRDMEAERQGAYATLNERVAALHVGHEQLQKETRNLVTALRSPQTRGRWGEMTLRNAVKAAGMAEHCDFDEQQTTTTADGLLRPDMIVHLPGGGHVVIDSKVPLDAFLKFSESEDEDERKAFLKKHASQLRTHVDQLSKKEYWRQFERSPEFVVAFIPGESLLAAACEADPGLQDHALGKGIILATPNTLVAALKTIALSWQQETLAENAREVRQLGAELYERLRTMTGHMESLQRNLSSTVEAYNKAVGSFESRVLVTARKFPGLGVVGMQSGELAELAPIEKAPRHLQAYQPELPDDEFTQPTIVALARRRRQHRHGVVRDGRALPAGRLAQPVRTETPPTYSAGVLHVHRSERADALVEMLRRPGGRAARRPMTAEVVSVPTRGIERWLTQRLSTHLGATPGRQDGVCANIAFPFPGYVGRRRPGAGGGHRARARPLGARAGRLAAARGRRGALRRALAGAAGPAHHELGRPWTGLEAVLERPARRRPLRPLRGAPARHAAALGRRVEANGEDEAFWQVELWRLLRDRIGPPSPAERLVDACQRLRDEPELLRAPPRLSLFGLTRLPASYLDVLEADGQRTGRPPLPAASRLRRCGNELAAGRRADVAPPPPARGPHRGSAAEPAPAVVGPRRPGDAARARSAVPHGEDVRRDAATGDADAAAAASRTTSGPTALPVGSAGGDVTRGRCSRPDDDSIRVHSCHGRGRQVEVLARRHPASAGGRSDARAPRHHRDVPRHRDLRAADSGDVRRARDEGDVGRPGADASRSAWPTASLRQTNPVMGVLAEVLELATARITATEVLDLAGRDPVRRRFRFSDDDLFRLEEWVDERVVRWGFDAAHRSAFQLEGIAANTWQSGLDRILLGVTMADERQRLFGGTLPLDDVDSGDIELAGRLAEFLDRLRTGARRSAHRLAHRSTAGPTRWPDLADSLTATTPARRLAARAADGAPRRAGRRGHGGRRRRAPVALSCDDVRSILPSASRAGRPGRTSARAT